MRVSLIVLLAIAGCDDEPAVAATEDLAMEIADLTGVVEPDLYGVVVEDMTPVEGGTVNPSDLAGVDAQNPASDLGGVGTMCNTACDCMPGLGCFNNECISGIAPVYCCEGMTCPGGSLCQHTAGGFGRCGVTTPDLGGFDPCPFISCQGGMGLQKCMNAGCSMCVANPSGGPPNMICAR